MTNADPTALAAGFGKWFDEIEVFSLRSERLFEELRINDLRTAARLRLWLEAAYEAGYRQSLTDRDGEG